MRAEIVTTPPLPEQPTGVAGRRQISAAGLRLIRAYEPWQALPYLHRRGHIAIGYGSRWRPNSPIPMTRPQAEMQLEADCALLAIYLAATLPADLPQCAIDAIASLCHDVGLLTFEKSTLRAAIKRDDRACAAEWSRFEDADGASRRRRHAEHARFRGEIQGADR